MGESFGNQLLTILYNLFHTLVASFLSPVFQAIDGLIQSLGLSNYVYLFNNILSTYVGPLVGFFFQFMGPHTISVIMLEITATIGYYGITMITTWILKLLNFIKKLPLA